MKVKIDKSIFEAAIDSDRQLELSFLLHIILYKNRHELKLTDEEILGCDSFAKLIPIEQDIIKEVISHTIFSSAESFDCEVKSGGEQEFVQKVFSVNEAIIYLMQPLSVMLENGLNDSYLIKAVFQFFNPKGELMRHLNEGWIRFENAGGCSNVKNVLQSQRGCYGERQKFLHCYVILDGDKRYLTDPEPDKKYEKLKNQLTDWNVHYHVFEKRCMENYLPDDAMSFFKNDSTKGWIDAYQMLTDQQKDFISISEGFTTDICKEDKKKVRDMESKLLSKNLHRRKKSYVREFLPEDEQSFYASVSNGNFLHLESGLPIDFFKINYPQLFENKSFVYKNNLLERTKHQNDPMELEHIASSIMSLI